MRLGDVADPWFVQSMVRGTDTVFHLAALIGDPALASKLGAAARQHVGRTFNQAAVIDRTESLYAELISGRQGHTHRD